MSSIKKKKRKKGKEINLNHFLQFSIGFNTFFLLELKSEQYGEAKQRVEWSGVKKRSFLFKLKVCYFNGLK